MRWTTRTKKNEKKRQRTSAKMIMRTKNRKRTKMRRVRTKETSEQERNARLA